MTVACHVRRSGAGRSGAAGMRRRRRGPFGGVAAATTSRGTLMSRAAPTARYTQVSAINAATQASQAFKRAGQRRSRQRDAASRTVEAGSSPVAERAASSNTVNAELVSSQWASTRNRQRRLRGAAASASAACSPDNLLRSSSRFHPDGRARLTSSESDSTPGAADGSGSPRPDRQTAAQPARHSWIGRRRQPADGRRSALGKTA